MTDLNTEDFEMPIQPHPEHENILLVGVYTRKYDRSSWTSINNEALKKNGKSSIIQILNKNQKPTSWKLILKRKKQHPFFAVHYQRSRDFF